LGCLGAVITGLLASFVVVALALAPAFDHTLPSPAPSNPDDPDIAIRVQEAYLDRTLSAALPEALSEETHLDVQAGNRLVFSGSVDLIIGRIDTLIGLVIAAEDGQIQLEVETVQAGGYDVLDLVDVDREGLSRRMSQAIQAQMEAGLGEGARVLGLRTEEDLIIITARWAP
jgi:uncharacterized protein YpmS